MPRHFGHGGTCRAAPEQRGDGPSKIAEKYSGVLIYDLIVHANKARRDDVYTDIGNPD